MSSKTGFVAILISGCGFTGAGSRVRRESQRFMTKDSAAELQSIAQGVNDGTASLSRSHMEAFISDSQFAQLRAASPSVDRAYSFASLSQHSFKDRLKIRAADLAFFVLIN